MENMDERVCAFNASSTYPKMVLELQSQNLRSTLKLESSQNTGFLKKVLSQFFVCGIEYNTKLILVDPS